MITDFKVVDESKMGGKPGEAAVVYVKDQQVKAVQRNGIVDRTYAVVTSKTPLLTVLRLMHRKKVKTILVFSEDKTISIDKLQGIITSQALVSCFMNSAELMES